MRKIAQIFVVFSEKLNFNDLGNPLGGVSSFHMIHIGAYAPNKYTVNAGPILKMPQVWILETILLHQIAGCQH